ncbi:uncharacterized protein B0H18DRAFT_1114405 [Fomitopsis serialis]|uniref:uncharacterized protein n=1 Tax=Fomitopsis serialis TaxID=139415 RepID=UPI002007714D|nr:uncharacterized protein B0H18DRAFT_1114405 [Neoantrodia serialis]KAH9935691.1 hypothetical protein B0H18DRAFT_1114405 [Neoantrodia serialis]
MPSYLVTGASRGIGLGIVTKLLKNRRTSWSPPCAIRRLTASRSWDEYPKTHLPSSSSILRLRQHREGRRRAAKVLPDGLDHLINNAGVSFQEGASFETIDLRVFEEELRVNTVAPIEVVRQFLPLVRKSAVKKVVLVSTIISSLELAPNLSTLAITYGITKAGLNILARKWAAVLYQEGITTVTLHPGWVETDLGVTIKDWWAKRNPDLKPISVQQSAEDVLRVIKEAKLEEKIKLYSHTGDVLPW